jgi:hypothetical protein
MFGDWMKAKLNIDPLSLSVYMDVRVAKEMGLFMMFLVLFDFIIICVSFFIDSEKSQQHQNSMCICINKGARIFYCVSLVEHQLSHHKQSLEAYYMQTSQMNSLKIYIE